MTLYNWQQSDWPHFRYDLTTLHPALLSIAEKAGFISGQLNHLTQDLQTEALLDLMGYDRTCLCSWLLLPFSWICKTSQVIFTGPYFYNRFYFFGIKTIFNLLRILVFSHCCLADHFCTLL